MRNKSYIFVLILLVGVSILTYQLIIPQFATQEYDKETVQNISQGITTTTEAASNQIEETIELDTEDSSEDEESSDEEPSSDLAQESIRPSVNAKKAAM